MMKPTRIIVIGIFVLCLVGGFLLYSFSRNPQASVSILSPGGMMASPTPFEFADLTIPYLRARSYGSALGNLEQYSTNASYISYLTSYDSDGLKINGLLTIPAGDKLQGGFPAIIFIHGYIPPGQYRTGQQYEDYVDFLARNGFVVLKIDLRGHDKSEGEPGGGYYSSDYIIDVLNAYSALQHSDFVNPERIGLWGHSMAGNVAMRSFAVKPDIPAVVIWAGAVYTYTDQREYGINDNSYQPLPSDSERVRKRQQIRKKYGDPSADSPFWKQVAVTDYLKNLKGAIEVHHANDDNVVSIEYSRNLMKLLDETTVSHQLFEYPSGGHNLQGASFTQAMQRTVEFFKKYL